MTARRRGGRRRFAAYVGGPAIAFVVAGALLVRESGVFHAIGLALLAYGLGIGVAAVFLALGHNPLRGQRD